MKTIDYKRCNDLIHITLDNMYEGSKLTIDSLDKNLINIINTEAPITLNTLKIFKNLHPKKNLHHFVYYHNQYYFLQYIHYISY